MRKMKGFQKLLACLLGLSMLFSSAMAAPWYIENGNITVDARMNGETRTQTVQQGETSEADDDPVISSRDPNKPSQN